MAQGDPTPATAELRKCPTKRTKAGKVLGRPPKGAWSCNPGDDASKPKVGRPRRGGELTTLRVIRAELAKRPGYAARLADERLRHENVDHASTRRQLSRIRKKIRELTGVDHAEP